MFIKIRKEKCLVGILTASINESGEKKKELKQRKLTRKCQTESYS